MKKLEYSSLENLSGGVRDTTGCVTGVVGSICGIVGCVACVMFPPAGLAAGMLLGLAAGSGTGITIGSTIIACSGGN